MKQLEHPKSSGLLDVLPEPEQLPTWLTQEDLDYYVEQYRTSGFRGPVNWYRNIPTNNGSTPELEGKKFSQPAAFVAGSEDNVLLYDPDWRDTFPAAFDDLRFLDWNIYARLEKLFLKLFLQEEDLHVNVLIDVSKSMNWASRTRRCTRGALRRR